MSTLFVYSAEMKISKLKLKRIMSNVGEILEVFDNDNAYLDEYHDEPIDDGT